MASVQLTTVSSHRRHRETALPSRSAIPARQHPPPLRAQTDQDSSRSGSAEGQRDVPAMKDTLDLRLPAIANGRYRVISPFCEGENQHARGDISPLQGTGQGERRPRWWKHDRAWPLWNKSPSRTSTKPPAVRPRPSQRDVLPLTKCAPPTSALNVPNGLKKLSRQGVNTVLRLFRGPSLRPFGPTISHIHRRMNRPSTARLDRVPITEKAVTAMEDILWFSVSVISEHGYRGIS